MQEIYLIFPTNVLHLIKMFKELQLDKYLLDIYLISVCENVSKKCILFELELKNVGYDFKIKS